MPAQDPFRTHPADPTTVQRIADLRRRLREGSTADFMHWAVGELTAWHRLPGRLHRVAQVVTAVLLPDALSALLRLGRRPDRRLWLFYDLAVSPITFDICWALAIAENRRLAAGADSVHLVLVPGFEAGLRREDPLYEQAVDAGQRRHRIERLMLPVAQQLPSLSGVTVCSSRRQAFWLRLLRTDHVYPEHYWPGIPQAHKPTDLLEPARAAQTIVLPFRPKPDAAAALEQWLPPSEHRRLVTITLRQYGYMTDRNSNLAAWGAFARNLDPQRYCVVIVPDSDAADGPLPDFAGFTQAGAAARDIDMRMALYHRAYLNLFVNNGPHGLCMFDAGAAYLMFKILTPSAPQTTEAYMQELGFDIGTDPAFARPWQHWVWEDDSLDAITTAFAGMTETLDRHDAARRAAGWPG
jgi:hypothetical protein